MSSYEVGLILGSIQARKWKSSKRVVLPLQVIKEATKVFTANAEMFDTLQQQDFLDGFNDAIETVYKSQFIALI
jgi:hypothetical protein